ncbi:CBS domain-containing protein [Exiguobacterium sp. Helios]|uniref:DRTGG domain-containing protein n=1 Tax=Exiguobacterium TaxID=33986 RepID=UPI00047926A7|nr:MULTISPECIES: DRTGG domain-containing protein [Exiguobacterium]MCK2156569.1 DRTGG domain-containing protein [Exiguobacterium sp. 17-1]QNR21793.1 CBS domain-containing protein [Exiguobacterium sp. Helios]
MPTKHEQIIRHIEDLDVGAKISVRQIAKDLTVSEGTAYRAIKEAENLGFVSTIERVGTIRIKKKQKENIEKLTFAEVVNIVDGQVLGGRDGLHKTLTKFVIGAMKLEAMMRYIDVDSLVIIGNREKAHELVLDAGAAVLITGGFDTTEDAKRLADEMELPIISTSYDTFTVATMINRAIYDRLIKKEILLVSDILIPLHDTFYLQTNDPIARWHELNEQTKHNRYPVIDEQMKVVGVVTAKDIIDRPHDWPVEKVMTRHPITVGIRTSVTNSAHQMVWEGIEMLPVIDQYGRLLGIISRQDVLKALQLANRQPQVGETFDDLITGQIKAAEDARGPYLSLEVSPQMTNFMGTASSGVLTTLLVEGATRMLRHMKKGDLVIENVSIYFIKPVQIESTITIRANVFDVGRKFGKVDVEMYQGTQIVAKALVTSQLIDR